MNTFATSTEIYPILFFLWFLSALADYLHFTYLWQLKEYRFDRFKDYLQSEKGKEFSRSYRIFIRPLVLLFVYTFAGDTLSIQLFALILGITDLGYNIYSYKKSFIKRPTFTPKAIIIIGISLLIELLCSIVFYPVKLMLLFFVSRYFVHATLVQLLQLPTYIIKQIYIFLATKKMKSFSHIITIGITGSYGKSSVKEFTSHILGTRYRVIKTPRNINTEIGVAKFILQHDFSNYDVFVCEMGAYKIGEIQKICRMVRPTIGVLTAINEQHLSLFGSIKKTQQAKYELLRAIPETGLVITNAENSYCTEFLSELACKQQVLFSADDDQQDVVDILITNIDSGLQGNTFDILHKTQGKQHVITPVIGAHHAYNITAAFLVAEFLSIPLATSIERAKTLPTQSHGSINIYQYGKATIIDDSYNANPRGFVSALEIMGKFSSEKKRIVITRGMLELGEESEEIHERLGGEIAFVADELIVISRDPYESLKKGVGKKYHTSVQLKTDPRDLFLYVTAQKEEEVIILLENRIPSNIVCELSAYKPQRE